MANQEMEELRKQLAAAEAKAEKAEAAAEEARAEQRATRARGYVLLTAREVINRPVPGLQLRVTPRQSNSATKATYPRTIKRLEKWPGFDDMLKQMEERLDNTTEAFVPVCKPGFPTEPDCRAAADESEVRAQLNYPSELLNAVARSMSLGVELVGGGSNRSASSTDYLIRLDEEATAEAEAEGSTSMSAQPQPASTSGGTSTYDDMSQTKLRRARRVVASGELKGVWQWPLEGTTDVTSLAMQLLKKCKLLDAIQQNYGDAVLDEAHICWVTNANYTLFLRRVYDDQGRDTKTLEVSEAVGTNRLLLAFLAVMEHAAKLHREKPVPPRQGVACTPLGGYQQQEQEQEQGQEQTQQEQQMQPQESQPAGGLRRSGRKRSSCADAVDESAQQQAVSITQVESSKRRSSSSGASHGTTLAPVPARLGVSQSESALESHSPYVVLTPTADLILVEEGLGGAERELGAGDVRLELFDFGQLGLTDVGIGCGRFGNLLQGRLHGEDIVVKMFYQKFPGAVAAFANELSAYDKLGVSVQGRVVPRLLEKGMFAHNGSLFLALTHEGTDLATGYQGEPLSAAVAAGIRKAVEGLHERGVVHNDVRLANFVENAAGEVKAVDLERALVAPGVVTQESMTKHQRAAQEDMAKVEALQQE